MSADCSIESLWGMQPCLRSCYRCDRSTTKKEEADTSSRTTMISICFHLGAGSTQDGRKFKEQKKLNLGGVCVCVCLCVTTVTRRPCVAPDLTWPTVKLAFAVCPGLGFIDSEVLRDFHEHQSQLHRKCLDQSGLVKSGVLAGPQSTMQA